MCRINCRPTDSVLQLKVKVEYEGGLTAETLSLCLPSAEQPLGESITVSACDMPTELYAVILQKVVIADIAPDAAAGGGGGGVAGVGFFGFGAPAQGVKLTDEQLQKACASPEAQAGDIIILKGCSQLCNLSCLVELEGMQALDISGCTGMDATTVPIAGLK